MIFQLKGLSWSEAKKEGMRYITDLDLLPKKDVLSTALSGGMKRKLHLAMALTGHSKVHKFHVHKWHAQKSLET